MMERERVNSYTRDKDKWMTKLNFGKMNHGRIHTKKLEKVWTKPVTIHLFKVQ